ncbi:uncharacterized protein YeaO (DUF488 family) [Chthoniobacter flavus]|nr:uncharacterized protein YeaO (DUF488 family) [Chthoniobacter flavus]
MRNTTMLKTKSIHTPIKKEDGLRILVARYRGHRVPTSLYDVWMACLGPSERLLKTVHEIDWRDWSRSYRQEMLGEGEHEKENPVIRNAGQKFTLRLIKHLAKEQNVTLLCHCPEDTEHCHRFLLRDLIESAKV